MTYLLPLLAALLPAVAALILMTRPLPRHGPLTRLPEAASLGALILSAIAVVVLLSEGPGTSPMIGAGGIGLSVRLDAVSATMLLLVSFIGWIVTRFAATFTDGEPGQGRFLGLLGLALASVLLLVQAGNLAQLALAWLAMGAILHRLLLTYPERIGAQRAARKKAVSVIAGSGALILAVILLGWAYGTTDIATILAAARLGDTPPAAVAAAALLAVAAILKSAQAPFHGWLTEVMEAPTPVSALLHAGVVNAGGFLLIRFADVMLTAPFVLAMLVMVGGFSALFGGLVMLTQPAVKTSLAWSTLAQMGFMVMQCGLALFPLALLHIVAHSLYKAHAFLSAGGAVAQVAGIRRPGPVAVPDGRAVLRAFGAALGIYAAVALGFWAVFGLADKSPQAIALGAILVFGVAYLIAQGFADAAPRALTQRTALASLAATVAYFALQVGAVHLMAGAVPPPPSPGPLEWTLVAVALLSFGLVATAQATFASWAGHPAAAGLRVHLSNGLYINALTDRLLGGWSAKRPL